MAMSLRMLFTIVMLTMTLKLMPSLLSITRNMVMSNGVQKKLPSRLYATRRLAIRIA
jgi:hypothetical protein